MPTLPDKASLGSTSIRAPRPIAQLQNPGAATSGVGEGLEQLGGAAARLGVILQRERDASQAIEADTLHRKGLIELKRGLVNDPNHGSHVATFEKRSAEITKEASELISSPSLRKKFLIQADFRNFSGRDAVLGRSITLGRNAQRTSIVTSLETQKQIYTDPNSTPEDKADALTSIKASIAVGVKSGLFKSKQQKVLQNKFVGGSQLTDAKIQILEDPRQFEKDLNEGKRYGELTNLQFAQFKEKARRAVIAKDKLDAEGVSSDRVLAAALGGNYPVDPGDKKSQKVINTAVMKSGIPDGLRNMSPDAAASLNVLVKNTNIFPQSALSSLRALSTNGSPEEKQYAYQTVGNVLRIRPSALGTGKSSKQIKKDATQFNSLVIEAGQSPKDAVAEIDRQRTPEFQKLKATNEKEGKKLAAKLDGSALAAAYDGFFSFEPELGGSPPRKSALIGTYRDRFIEHYTETGNADTAKSMAVQDMKDIHNVSNINGTLRLMRHPPERHYPAIDGSFEYFSRQLVETVNEKAGKEIPLGKIFIEPVLQTSLDIHSGKPPGYGVVWAVEKDGVTIYEGAPGLVFRPDVKSEIAASTKRNGVKFKLLREMELTLDEAANTGGEVAVQEVTGADVADVEIKRQKRHQAIINSIDIGGLG